MKKLPMISVILPVFNGENFLKDTIDSIIRQTYKQLEIIIIDDCSTDNSKELILSYSDDRIKTIFLSQNTGVCSASNKGFAVSTGEYCALIGHDDIWNEDKIEKQLKFLIDNKEYDACMAWCDIIDEDGRNINVQEEILYNAFRHTNYSQEECLQKMFFQGNYFCAPSALIKMQVLKEIGYYKPGLLQTQDYDLWLRVLVRHKVYIIQEELLKYRRFLKSDKNLSKLDLETLTRTYHEIEYLQENLIFSISDEDFIRFFSIYFSNKQSFTSKELMCERVFLMQKLKNPFFSRRLLFLFETEDYLNTLSEKFNYTLKDFYQFNAKLSTFEENAVFLEKEVKRLHNIIEEKDKVIMEYQQLLNEMATYLENTVKKE